MGNTYDEWLNAKRNEFLSMQNKFRQRRQNRTEIIQKYSGNQEEISPISVELTEDFSESGASDSNPIKGGTSAPGYRMTNDYGAMFAPGKDDDTKFPHTGMDFVSTSREIVSTMNGKVIFADEHPDGTSRATGTLIIIKYDNDQYGLYGHLDKNSFKVKAGDKVIGNADLGKYYCGVMGISSGGHLHYGRYLLDDSKKEDKITNINEFVRQFTSTGYFYDKTEIPEDKEIKEGIFSVRPGFNR